MRFREIGGARTPSLTRTSTWFLDACGQTTHRKRRLLLTNGDLGVAIPARMLQLGLNFGDALRVLEEYLTALATIRRDIGDELPHVRAALSFAWQLVPQTKPQRSTANP